MSRIAPQPVISQVVRTWHVQPGMTLSVAEDNQGRLWIEESCPIGNHFWTVEQAAELSLGCRTQAALAEAVALGRERQSLDHLPTLPSFDAELESAVSAAPARLHRAAVKSNGHLARA